MSALLIALLLAAGCDQNPLAGNEPDKNCDPRIPFWPDVDGDGFGDAGSSVYLGCAAPEGYVDEPPATDTDGDTDTDGPSDTLTDSDG